MTASIVVDASVAVKWFLPEEDSDQALRLLGASHVLHAPELLQVEAANAVWKHVVRGELDPVIWKFAQSRLRRSIGHWHDTGALLPVALDLACKAAHPVYDLVYLALSRHVGARLVTADRRFLAKAPKGEVIALKDWEP